jgi:hypothetical protein
LFARLSWLEVYLKLEKFLRIAIGNMTPMIIKPFDLSISMVIYKVGNVFGISNVSSSRTSSRDLDFEYPRFTNACKTLNPHE